MQLLPFGGKDDDDDDDGNASTIQFLYGERKTEREWLMAKNIFR